MARGFLSTMNKLAREIERSARAAERAARQADRERARQLREEHLARIRNEKTRKEFYVNCRIDETSGRNEDLEQQIHDLETILTSSLDEPVQLNFDLLKVIPAVPELVLGELGEHTLVPVKSKFIAQKPAWYLVWLPWVQESYKARQKALDDAYQGELAEYRREENVRLKKITEITAAHEEKVAHIMQGAEEQNSAVDEAERSYRNRELAGINLYFSAILDLSAYPETFPKQAKTVYSAESKLLVIEYDLPVFDDITPTAKTYKYTKSTDTISATSMPDKQRKALYTSAIAQTVLRSLYELFEADSNNLLDTVAFNGFVDTVNPATGLNARTCIVSVRTNKETFTGLDLRRVDPVLCLQQLNASFSRSPAELVPVRPIVEFNMNDPRFITESDVLSELDTRPNLMDLTPNEFESLITNLFQKMGLDTKLTQASRDGGVDCVAYDPRPIFGGKVVIQAKRYKNTVGVSAVRDLFGTMQNEGASKGILVATSGYGKAAFDFANGKPIELLDGANLLFLLAEHAGIEAKIIMPMDAQ